MQPSHLLKILFPVFFALSACACSSSDEVTITSIITPLVCVASRSFQKRWRTSNEQVLRVSPPLYRTVGHLFRLTSILHTSFVSLLLIQTNVQRSFSHPLLRTPSFSLPKMLLFSVSIISLRKGSSFKKETERHLQMVTHLTSGHPTLDQIDGEVLPHTVWLSGVCG